MPATVTAQFLDTKISKSVHWPIVIIYMQLTGFRAKAVSAPVGNPILLSVKLANLIGFRDCCTSC